MVPAVLFLFCWLIDVDPAQGDLVVGPRHIEEVGLEDLVGESLMDASCFGEVLIKFLLPGFLLRLPG